MEEVLNIDGLRLTSREDLVAAVKKAERAISQLRARQLVLLRELSRRSWPSEGTDTARLARDLDVSHRTADALLETARRTPELSPQMSELASGDATFDRAHALAELFMAGGREIELAEAKDKDIAGIRRLAARCRRIRRRDERQAHQERHVRSWLSLDETAGFVNAQLGAVEWHTVTTALDRRADEIPRSTGSREQRRADALVAIAHDWLSGHLNDASSGGALVSVTVDATTAGATDAEAGVRVTAGPRIGPDTLDAIVCEGAVEVLIDRDSGMPLAVGPTGRVVPPKVRRTVLTRDQGCTIGHCNSRYRLEVHHIVPRSRGGTHDLENLTTLCWYHHHIEVHRAGNAIDLTSPPDQRRIVPAPDW
ncbi:MAG: DUF222 domain-containing protein [Acidimicrobiia bacterium]|nr:DUF222 domain-containing protein [Acidimicrobiia bacterium]